MRVLHVITKGDVGGAQTHVVELAAAQRRAGLDVTVVAGTGGPGLDRCRDAGCAVSVVPSLGDARTQLWQRTAIRDLWGVIETSRPDIVHAHSSNAGFVARVACRRHGVPCVYTAHGWPFQRGAAWRQRVLSLVGEFVGGRLGDGVICLTEAEADRARRARVVRRGRCWVVPNGLADVSSDLVHRHGDDPVALVMVARFAPPKQQERLIAAAARLADADWTLTFVGDGPELESCRTGAAAALGGRVSFLGHRDDVPEILARHDALVLWSAYEGLPISILEGMRAGLCCVASDLAGVRVLFGDPSCGLTARDDDELVAALRRVVTEPTVRSDLGNRARERFVRCFSADAMVAAVGEVYSSVLARR